MSKDNVTKMSKPISEDSILRNAFQRMLQSQGNFSDLAIERAIAIGKNENVDFSKSQILGVSFAPDMAVVAILYQPTILGPNDNGEPRQVQVPVPAECLFVDDWEPIYHDILEKSIQAQKAMQDKQTEKEDK